MKNIITYSCLLVLISLTLVGTLFGQDAEPFVEQKASVVDSVYENPDFLPLIDVEQAQIQLDDLSKAFQQIESEYNQVDSRTEELQEKYEDIQVTIEYIISDTERMEQALKEDLTKISLSSRKIASLKEKLLDLKQELNASKEYVKVYAKFLYKLHNDYYTTDLELSDVKLLAKSENIATTLSSEDLVELLMKKLQDLVGTIQEKQSLYANYAMQINDEKMAYSSSVQKYKLKLNSLEEQEEQLYKLLSYIKSDLNNATKRVEEIQESKSELQNQIGFLQDATSASEHGVSRNSAVFSLLQEKDREDGKKYFSWPVFPIEQVAYYFRDAAYFQEYKQQLNGVRLSVPQGSEVRAPAPAIVYKVFESSDISLGWMVLVHKYGYITIISPLSEISVDPGDVVMRGEIIGKSGGQPGTIGAGLKAKNPHLDIELLKNGSHIDPFNVMDISIFKDEKVLPEKYRNKYLHDFFSRDVDLSVLLDLEGETLEERRDSFLQTYASGPYRDPAIWYEGASRTGIDPLLGICIGFAETSFKHFKSPNNIGNVGNDDSGNTVDYESPLAGVIALYNVLNNQYLGSYQTLDQLSRYGNREGYIYASSPYNWQKNTMKCLSSLYNAHVPEDYAFRIQKGK